MKHSNYTVRIIEPNEGYTLTQAGDVETSARVLSKKIYLAVNDDPANWTEITDAEAEEIRAEQDRLAEEEQKKHENNE